MTREKLTASQKAGRSIKRTPWKVEVHTRLDRVREDIEIAVSAGGWEINSSSAWPPANDEASEKAGAAAKVTLEMLDGTTATPQMHEAEAVILATSGYMAKTEATLQLSAQFWQRPWEWLTGGLLMSAYTSLHAAETNRVLLLSSDQLAALLPTIRQRAVRYLPADDPRLKALQGLPDPTEPTHQALARAQSRLVQVVASAQASATTQESGTRSRGLNGQQETVAAKIEPASPVSSETSEQAESESKAPAAIDTSSGASPAAPAPSGPNHAPPGGGPSNGGGGNGGPPNGSIPPGTDLLTLTGMLGRDQQIASMAMGEATHAEDQQQAQVRRFRGVLLGTFLGLLTVVILLAILGGVHPSYFPLCVHNQAANGTTACPTGGQSPDKADLAFIMAIGGIGAVLAVAANLSGLNPTGVRYSLSVIQGLVKIPFGAITAMLGIIILSTQSNIGVLATHAGLISTAIVFGYSQQLFTKLIDKRADDVLSQADGNS